MYTKIFKLKYLVLTTKICFNTSSGEGCFCDMYNIFFRADFFIGSKSHGMFRDTIDQYKIDILFGSSNLHLYMRKISIMLFVFANKRCFKLSIAFIHKLCGRNPFSAEKELAFGSKADGWSVLYAEGFGKKCGSWLSAFFCGRNALWLCIRERSRDSCLVSGQTLITWSVISKEHLNGCRIVA